MKRFAPALLAPLLLAAAPHAYCQGKELTGVRAAATTPALSPEEAQAKFVLPEGFDIRLFASEPMVINPVAMSWDDRGRLWVVELFEYPLGAPADAVPRDTIKILEDTDGDERADKMTVFASGLNLATGILVGDGGVYVGQAPHLFFLEDLDGDDRADQKTVLKTGFGLEDRHELLNGFTWGPDGWLYMTHGVFTHSKVRELGEKPEDGFTMNAAVARYHPGRDHFEVFADGTSNPWGVDFDANGNAFVTACVIDHMFHMAAGGHYVRQAGAPENPHGYGLLPSIVDHRHFRAAFCGVQVYNGHQYPREYQGTIFQGNIHGNAVHQDKLARHGASFKASHVQDFLSTDDGWFRPVSTQTGPDGCLWIMDWHDKYPCYQNARANPEGVNRTFGRIWRVVHGGKPLDPRPEKPLSKLSTLELVATLGHANSWHRRTAQRLLGDLGAGAPTAALTKLLSEKHHNAAYHALLTLHEAGTLTEQHLDTAARSQQENLRIWAARLTGERLDRTPASFARLETLATDDSAQVRLAVATALRQHSSAALTVNHPIDNPESILPVVKTLALASKDAEDKTLPFLIWMALEPLAAKDPIDLLDWLATSGHQATPLSDTLTYKLMLRICDGRDPAHLDAAAGFLAFTAEEHPGIAASALGGLLEGQKGRAIPPKNIPETLFATLRENLTDDQEKLRINRLGALWGDSDAVAGTLSVALDPEVGEAARIESLNTAAQFRTPDAREQVLTLVSADSSPKIVTAALRTLRTIGDDSLGTKLIERYASLTPALRREVTNTLILRPAWANALLSALEENAIATSEIPAPVVRALLDAGSEHVRARAKKAVGHFRPTTGEIAKIIAQKRAVVVSDEPPVDLAEGQALAAGMCLTCHNLHGQGHAVGPDLTGVGRSSVDALLTNIIDPDQIIGLGYELVTIKTKDGRTIAGRLTTNTDTRAVLQLPGGIEETVAKQDIASLETSEESVMPKGLHNLPDAQFRNLIWYLLNPPEDNRPMTPQLRQQLIDGDGTPHAAAPEPPTDRESIALWNPEWSLDVPDFEGTPKKLPDFRGRKNVLVTHPYNRQKPSTLHRHIHVPKKGKTVLTVKAAAHDHPEADWLLQAAVGTKKIFEATVDRSKPWHEFHIDLSRYAGKHIDLELENVPNNWMYEFAYWGSLTLETK